MISFPTTVDAALAALADTSQGLPEPRAGGTDLQHRRGLGIARGPLVDLRYMPDMGAIEPADGGLRIGAGVRVAQLAAHPLVREGYPALAQAAGALANPQIRAVATVGGNLLQRNRCWYFRNPSYTCLKRGGATCFAREGDHLYHGCFDLGPCVAPHPSTLGLAFVAYRATLEVAGGLPRTVEDLYGDGQNARADHHLEPDELLTAVILPAPTAGEQSAYVRVSSRELAEWPLVDAVVRLVVREGRIRLAAVLLGGVASVPYRHRLVEDAMTGQLPNDATWARVRERAPTGASPLPATRYKVDLLAPAIEDAILRALGGPPVAPPPPLEPTRRKGR